MRFQASTVWSGAAGSVRCRRTSRRTRRRRSSDQTLELIMPAVVSLLPLSHNDVASTGGHSQGLDMIRIIAKLFAVTIVLTAFLHVAPVFAGPPAVWVSSTGSDGNPCTAAQPCATFFEAVATLGGNTGGQLNCLNSPQPVEFGIEFFDPLSLTIDCAGAYNTTSSAAFQFAGLNQTIEFATSP